MPLLISGVIMASGGGTDVVTIFAGFLVILFILMELHGYSAASAIFSIPVLILSSLILFVSYILALGLTAIVAGAAGGIVGLVLVAIVGYWLFRSAAGVTAQNYLLFAILLFVLLLLI